MTASYLPYTLYYGGIPIPYNKTNMQIEPVYDDTDIDLLYNHITITAQGLLNPNIIYNIGPADYNPGSPQYNPGDCHQTNRDITIFNNPGGHPATNAQALLLLRTWLNNPRQRLIMTDAGGNVMIDTQTKNSYGTSTIDAKNGPSPKAIVIDFDGQTFAVTITIETWLAECSIIVDDVITAASPSIVLSNRWSMSQTIDENGLSTYTTIGVLILRTDVFNVNASDPKAFGTDTNPWASVFRTVLTPVTSIFPNCNRISQIYKQSSDNTKLEYTITDQERYRPGVSGITSFQAEFDQSSSTGIGGSGSLDGSLIGNFTGLARGSPAVTKQTLFSFLVQVMYSRVGNYDNLIKYSVKEMLHDNELSINATWLLSPTKATPATTNVPSITNNKTINSDNFKLRIQDTSGSGNTDQNNLGIGAAVPIVDYNNTLIQVNSNFQNPTSNLTVNPPYNVGHVRDGRISLLQNPNHFVQNVPSTIKTAPPIFATIFSNHVNDTLASNYCAYPLPTSGNISGSDLIYQQPQSAANAQSFSTNPNYLQKTTATSGEGTASNTTPSVGYGGGGTGNLATNVISAIQKEATYVASAIIQFTNLFSTFITQIAPVQNNPRQYYLSYTVEQQMRQNNGILQLPIGANLPPSSISNNNFFAGNSPGGEVQPYSGGNSPTSNNNNPFCQGSITLPPGYSRGATPNAPSSQNQTSVFSQVARGQDIVKVIFNASRMNSCPDVPALSPQGEGSYVLLDSFVTMFSPQFLPDGVNRIYSVHGELTFGVIASQQLGSVPLLFPSTPVDTLKSCQYPQLGAPLANSPTDASGKSGVASTTLNGQLLGNLFVQQG